MGFVWKKMIFSKNMCCRYTTLSQFLVYSGNNDNKVDNAKLLYVANRTELPQHQKRTPKCKQLQCSKKVLKLILPLIKNTIEFFSIEFFSIVCEHLNQLLDSWSLYTFAKK